MFRVTIGIELAKDLGYKPTLEKFGVNERELSYHDRIELNVPPNPNEIEYLISQLSNRQHIRGAKVTVENLQHWLGAVNGKYPKARSVKGFHSMLLLYLSKVPDHLLYQYDNTYECHLSYYIEQVQYHP